MHSTLTDVLYFIKYIFDAKMLGVILFCGEKCNLGKLILLDQNSVKHSLDVLNVFSQCAGLNINIDKTKAKYIGLLMNCDHFQHGLSWIKTPIETLSIAITANTIFRAILISGK